MPHRRRRSRPIALGATPPTPPMPNGRCWSRCCQHWLRSTAEVAGQRRIIGDIVDAIRYVTHNGCVWRALPCDFPPWRTVYGFYWRGNASGATSTLHDQLHTQVRLVAGRHPIPSAAIIDSQSVRAADTVPKQSRGYDAAKGQRAETPPCGGYPRAAAGDRGHRRQRPRPRWRPAAAVPAAPWRPRHPVGLGRCRLRGQAGHLGKVDPALAAGHCPSAPGTRLRGPAAPLGHRADLRLAQPVSPHPPQPHDTRSRQSPAHRVRTGRATHGGRSG